MWNRFLLVLTLGSLACNGGQTRGETAVNSLLDLAEVDCRCEPNPEACEAELLEFDRLSTDEQRNAWIACIDGASAEASPRDLQLLDCELRALRGELDCFDALSCEEEELDDAEDIACLDDVDTAFEACVGSGTDEISDAFDRALETCFESI